MENDVRITDVSAALALCSLMIAMLGCTGDPFALEPEADDERVAPTLRIAPPELPLDRFASHEDGEPYRILDHAELSVAVDGVPLELDEPDAAGRSVVRWSRPPGSRVELRVEWAESVPRGDGTSIAMPLATHERSFTVEQSMVIEIGPTDYAVDAGPNAERDRDRDGDGNLLERRAGTDPFNGSVCPNNCDPAVSLYIKRVDRQLTNNIEIDSRYDDEWRQAEAFATDGPLFIDEPGFSSEPGGGNGGPTRFIDADGDPFEFGIMHDGESLFLVAYGGEDFDRNTEFGDSENSANDDAVTIYVDTDDDPTRGGPTSALVIPLMGLDGMNDSSFATSPRARRTDRDSPTPYLPDDLVYATCVCDGARQYWEMMIPLASLGIVRGQPFGLEVTMTDDSDGGETVTQWLWLASPDGAGGVDSLAQVIAR